MKQNNSQECPYRGYKLSNVETSISHSDNVIQVSVGCEDDDTFYEGTSASGRVVVMIELEDGQMAHVDLEEVLVFASRHCQSILKRAQEGMQ